MILLFEDCLLGCVGFLGEFGVWGKSIWHAAPKMIECENGMSGKILCMGRWCAVNVLIIGASIGLEEGSGYFATDGASMNDFD